MQNAHLRGSQQFRNRERGELSASTPIGWTLLPLSVGSTHAASLHPGRHVHSCCGATAPPARQQTWFAREARLRVAPLCERQHPGHHARSGIQVATSDNAGLRIDLHARNRASRPNVDAAPSQIRSEPRGLLAMVEASVRSEATAPEFARRGQLELSSACWFCGVSRCPSGLSVARPCSTRARDCGPPPVVEIR